MTKKFEIWVTCNCEIDQIETIEAKNEEEAFEIAEIRAKNIVYENMNFGAFERPFAHDIDVNSYSHWGIIQ